MSKIILQSRSTPSAPPAGKVIIYIDQNDDLVKQIDSNGDITILAKTGITKWISATTYTVDTVVWYETENGIYRCITGNSDVTFTPANWQLLGASSWGDLDLTGSDIADIESKSHTSLTDIGTTSHADIDTAVSNSANHISNTSNPHSVTKDQVLSGDLIDNDDVSATAAIAYSKLNIANGDLTIAKTSGLQDALDAKVPNTEKGSANGVAELDVNGHVPSAQLPSYVDDVEEYADYASFPVSGESGKIYLAIDTGIIYRWSGSVYAEISASLALGELSTTAYRGDRGKTAYDHSQATGNPHSTTYTDLGAAAADHAHNIEDISNITDIEGIIYNGQVIDSESVTDNSTKECLGKLYSLDDISMTENGSDANLWQEGRIWAWLNTFFPCSSTVTISKIVLHVKKVEAGSTLSGSLTVSLTNNGWLPSVVDPGIGTIDIGALTDNEWTQVTINLATPYTFNAASGYGLRFTQGLTVDGSGTSVVKIKTSSETHGGPNGSTAYYQAGGYNAGMQAFAINMYELYNAEGIAFKVTSSGAENLKDINLRLKNTSSGNPTSGLVTAYVYSVVSSDPEAGTLVATSSNTINLANVTDSYANYKWLFDEESLGSADYWAVFKVGTVGDYSVTIEGENTGGTRDWSEYYSAAWNTDSFNVGFVFNGYDYNSGFLGIPNGTGNKAIVSDADKKLVESTATDTEVGYLSGVTSAIQTQLNGKSDTTHDHDADYSALGHTHVESDITDLGNYEESLGNPDEDGKVLSSTTLGVRSWVTSSDGADGADGKTVLSGAVDPTTEGVDGDFYINTVTSYIFGPKATTWPAGVSLVGAQGIQGEQGIQGIQGDPGIQGPQGDQGIQGEQGIQGIQGDQGIQGIQGDSGLDGDDGRTVLNGAVDPTTEGVDGDFYINTVTSYIFGPKNTTWPAGVSLMASISTGITNKLLKYINGATPTVGDSGIFESGGNVGIGTGVSAPNSKLEVNGGDSCLRLRNTSVAPTNYWKIGPNAGNTLLVYNQSNVGVWMGDGGNTWTSGSDIRLKKDFLPIENALEKTCLLNGLTFKFKSDSDEYKRRVGVIAQELQEVLPEAVTEMGGYLGVNYTDMIPLLIEAIKELNAEKEAMKERISTIEAFLDENFPSI